MKVLLIGGTGVISSDVCYYSIAQGYDVYILNRGRRKEKIANKAHLIIADFKKESVTEIRNKIGENYFDVVVDFLSYKTKQLRKLASIVNCYQYILVSTATIYEKQEATHLYKEIDPKGNTEWDYCVKKYACEKELVNISVERHFKYTIVRPYVTYNETRFPYQISPIEYYTIVERIKKGLPIPVCGINTVTTVTDSKDFAIGLVGLFMNTKAYNEDFHITTDITTQWSHIVKLLAAKYGKQVNFVDIPLDFWKEMRNTVIDIDEILEDKSRPMVFDNSKIKATVPEFCADIGIEQSITKIYEYFVENENLKINYLWSGCIDRILWDYNKTHVNISNYNFPGIRMRVLYYIGKNSLICKGYHLMSVIKNKISAS